MIGYKATYNGYCLNQLYEVGQTHTFYGELIMCLNGFHFCQDLYDVFTYYNPNKDIKVFKVEALGNIITEYNKSVTDRIKILEEVDLRNMVIEKNNKKKYFNDKGSYIRFEISNGCWYNYEYDEKDNLIKIEDSYGYWVKLEYDENNNCIKKEHGKG
ncbi:hypothetical protein M0P65_05365 [Candidatus Gracilibacteria bacterium]|nr:hypothetical protein [Candidatus Gracilibacteria bacterium]